MLGALADDATAQAAEPPLISVMVPTCNRPAFVKLTLRQIERQTWSNLEVESSVSDAMLVARVAWEDIEVDEQPMGHGGGRAASRSWRAPGQGCRR